MSCSNVCTYGVRVRSDIKKEECWSLLYYRYLLQETGILLWPELDVPEGSNSDDVAQSIRKKL